jgi:hypothetical protein
MCMRHYVLVLCCLGIALGADAQTMYRCQDGARTVYSDKPCWEGLEVKRMTATGGRTPEEILRAREQARAEDRASIKPIGKQIVEKPKTADDPKKDKTQK